MKYGSRVTIECPSCGAEVERTVTMTPLAAHGQCYKCWPWEPDDELEASVRTIRAWQHQWVKRHGTITRYTYYRCRCDECKAAMAAYMREKRRRDKHKGAA